MKITQLKNAILANNSNLKEKVDKDIGYQIGKQIEFARALRCISQKELAEKVKTQQSSISRVESGSTIPSLSFLMKIASALGTYLIPPKLALVEKYNNSKIDYTSTRSLSATSINMNSGFLSPVQHSANSTTL